MALIRELHVYGSVEKVNEKECSERVQHTGFGKRLLPHTKNTPKPLLPISGKPILEHIICKLRDEGFYNLYISTHYLGKKIENTSCYWRGF